MLKSRKLNRVAESMVIKAPAAYIYAVFADYRHAHHQILPPEYFTSLSVLEGGQGAGTRFRATMLVMGKESEFTMVVAEPEPGRILTETDIATGLVTSFIVEPAASLASEGDAPQPAARVTIATEWHNRPGLSGWLESLLLPALLRRIYRAELSRVAAYVAEGEIAPGDAAAVTPSLNQRTAV